MTHYTDTVTAYVKGGMPVQVSGTVVNDESGCCVENLRVFWASTGKPVTAKFEKSLTESDWELICEALM